MGAGKSLNRREKNSGEEKSRRRVRGLLLSFLTFLRPNFFLACLDFSLPPLTAPGSPRMNTSYIEYELYHVITAGFANVFLLQLLKLV